MVDSHRLLTFTPDQELVHVQGGQLRMTSLANRQGRLAREGEEYLTDLPFLDENNPYAEDIFVDNEFSPDGQKMVIMHGNFYGYPPIRLTIVDRQTGQFVEIEAEAEAKLSGFVKWSPDSKTLVYSTLPQDLGDEVGLWLIDADGHNPRQLTKTTEWKKFEFSTWLSNGQAILYILSPSTGTSVYRETSYQIIGLADENPQTLFIGGTGIQLVDNNLIFYRENYDSQTGQISEFGYWMTTLSY